MYYLAVCGGGFPLAAIPLDHPPLSKKAVTSQSFFFLGAKGGEEECKCSAAQPACSQLHQQGRVPGWLGRAGADVLLPTKRACIKLPGGYWLKIIKKL